MGKRKSDEERRPDISPEAREARLVSLAMDLAEKQLREGTASATVIGHFLKHGSMREELEQRKLLEETALIETRRDAIASSSRLEELYINALDAMRTYRGRQSDEMDEGL